MIFTLPGNCIVQFWLLLLLTLQCSYFLESTFKRHYLKVLCNQVSNNVPENNAFLRHQTRRQDDYECFFLRGISIARFAIYFISE